MDGGPTTEGLPEPLVAALAEEMLVELAHGGREDVGVAGDQVVAVEQLQIEAMIERGLLVDQDLEQTGGMDLPHLPDGLTYDQRRAAGAGVSEAYKPAAIRLLVDTQGPMRVGVGAGEE
jgi:hypothetical protein